MPADILEQDSAEESSPARSSHGSVALEPRLFDGAVGGAFEARVFERSPWERGLHRCLIENGRVESRMLAQQGSHQGDSDEGVVIIAISDDSTERRLG